MRSLPLIVALALLTTACGDDSPTGPSSAPPSTSATLTGQVTSASGGPVAGATVLGLDGTNASRSTTTDASGNYSMPVQTGNTNFSANGPGHTELRKGMTLVAGANRLDFSLQPAALFQRTGTGNTVFDKPAYVARVRITGQYSGNSSNFIVWCGNNLLVNELLGTGWGRTTYDGTHATPNCTQVEIRNSTGVAWSFTEVR